MQVRLGSINIDEGSEYGLDGDLCPLNDVFHKGGELGVFGAASARASSRRGGRRTAHSIVDSLNDAVYEVFWRRVRLRSWVKGERHVPMTGRETLMLVSSRRAGECVAESTREFGWTGEALAMAEMEMRAVNSWRHS